MCDRTGAVRQEKLFLAVWHWHVFLEIPRNQWILSWKPRFCFRLTSQNGAFEPKKRSKPGGVNENYNHKGKVLVWGERAGKRKQKKQQ